MPKDGKLNDEEIRQLIKEANEQAQLYGDDGEPLPEKAIADAASKAMYDQMLNKGKLTDSEIRQIRAEVERNQPPSDSAAHYVAIDADPVGRAIADAASKAMINRELRYHLNGTASDLV